MQNHEYSNANSDSCKADASSLVNTDSLTGTVIGEKVELLTVIGKGANATVYKAKHKLLDQFVAVKVLHKHNFSSEESRERFFKEAQILSSFSHDNIVKFQAFGLLQDGTAFLILEYLDGQTLQELIAEKSRIPETDILNITEQVCAALTYVHEKGVLHRDLKPANIMICGSEKSLTVKLFDFGILKQLHVTESQGLTKTGAILGSVNYMSPEQCTSAPVDARSDIYSLGCIIYEMVAGTPPMQDTSEMLIMNNQVNKLVDKVPAKEAISKELEQLIRRCLNKDPKERYQSAAELSKALEACRFSRKHKAKKPKAIAVKIIAGLVLLLVGFLSIGIILCDNRKEKDQADKTIYNPERKTSRWRLPVPVKDQASLNRAESWLSSKLSASPLTESCENLCKIYVECRDFRRNSTLPALTPGERQIENLLKTMPRKRDSRFDNYYLYDMDYRARFYSYLNEDKESLRILKSLEGEKDIYRVCESYKRVCFQKISLKQYEAADQYFRQFSSYTRNTSYEPWTLVYWQDNLINQEKLDEAKELSPKIIKLTWKFIEHGDIGRPSMVSQFCLNMNKLNQLNELVKFAKEICQPVFGCKIDSANIHPQDDPLYQVRNCAARALLKLQRYDEAEKIARAQVEQMIKCEPENVHCDSIQNVINLSYLHKGLGKAEILQENSRYLEKVRQHAGMRRYEQAKQEMQKKLELLRPEWFESDKN